MTNDLKTKIAEALVNRRRELLARSGGPILIEPVELAQAALQAIHDAGFGLADLRTHAVVPREPTEAMWTAGYDVWAFGEAPLERAKTGAPSRQRNRTESARFALPPRDPVRLERDPWEALKGFECAPAPEPIAPTPAQPSLWAWFLSLMKGAHK